MIFCVGIQLGAIKSKIAMDLIKYSLVLYINEKPRTIVNERKMFHFLSTSDDWRAYAFLKLSRRINTNQLFTVCCWSTKILKLLIYWECISIVLSL